MIYSDLRAAKSSSHLPPGILAQIYQDTESVASALSIASQIIQSQHNIDAAGTSQPTIRFHPVVVTFPTKKNKILVINLDADTVEEFHTWAENHQFDADLLKAILAQKVEAVEVKDQQQPATADPQQPTAAKQDQGDHAATVQVAQDKGQATAPVQPVKADVEVHPGQATAPVQPVKADVEVHPGQDTAPVHPIEASVEVVEQKQIPIAGDQKVLAKKQTKQPTLGPSATAADQSIRVLTTDEPAVPPAASADVGTEAAAVLPSGCADGGSQKASGKDDDK